jgi:hypothetical protein
MMTQQVAKKFFITHGAHSIAVYVNGEDVKFSSQSVNELLKKQLKVVPITGLPMFLSKRALLKALGNEEIDEDNVDEFADLLYGKIAKQAIRQAKKVKEGEQLKVIFDTILQEHPTHKGCYRLNDLHAEAESLFGRNKKAWQSKSPGIWFRDNKKTIAGITAAIKSNLHCGKSTVQKLSVSIKGTCNPMNGTYVHIELLIAYAEWLHPTLHAKVLKVFSDYADAKLTRKAKGTLVREESKEGFTKFGKAMRKYNASVQHGTNAMYYGCFKQSKKDIKKELGVKEPFRDNMPESMLSTLSVAQTGSTYLLNKKGLHGQAAANELITIASKNAAKYMKTIDAQASVSKIKAAIVRQAKRKAVK